MKKLKNIALVFGTRPEAIKMAPLFHRLRAYPDKFDVEVCVTAQHRQMLDQVLKTFQIQPSFDLNLMTNNQSVVDLTANVLKGLKSFLEAKKPDIIVVHGDTSTTLAASIAGFLSEIDVAHIEAGLRTYDLRSPFPEEFNRQVVTKIAKWHFAPTALSHKNLINEGVDPKSIIITGNTVIDALQWTMNRIYSNPVNLQSVDKSTLVKTRF
jgi:UDP-N-acetylglucosamine 2-epimerase (non-hydrolysing)